jgi:putative ABC transport system substrate-binding protein
VHPLTMHIGYSGGKVPIAGIRRRDLLAAAGSTAVAWLLAAPAQQITMPVIGFLHQGGVAPNKGFVVRFRQGLRESGYVDGQNVTTEFRWAEDYDRSRALATDLALRQITIMVAAYRPAALAAKSAIARSPIVFVSGSDPIETGLVNSINRPGGNVTGVNLFSGMLASKRLELLRELLPNSELVAVLVNPTNTNAETNMKDLQSAALGVRQRIQVLNAGSDLDLETATSKPPRRSGSVFPPRCSPAPTR